MRNLSLTKTGRKFGGEKRLSADREMAKSVAAALREDFGEASSAVKTIAQVTQANVDTVTNWYQGKNLPGSRYLLVLARSSPGVLRLVLTTVGGDELWDVFQLVTRENRPTRQAGGDLDRGDSRSSYVSENVSKRRCAKSEARQEWLADQLRKSPSLRAEEMAAHWKVSVRTAFRDIERYRCAANSAQIDL